MNNIFDRMHSDHIINRIDKLSSTSNSKWGKMNVSQMLAHCSAFQDIPIGDILPPRDWIGVIIGRFVKPIFYNDKPLSKKMSTISDTLITDEREFEIEKEKLKSKLIHFRNSGPKICTDYPHPFFGKLTTEQWGKGIYKHLDHHLKQFGV